MAMAGAAVWAAAPMVAKVVVTGVAAVAVVAWAVAARVAARAAVVVARHQEQMEAKVVA